MFRAVVALAAAVLLPVAVPAAARAEETKLPTRVVILSDHTTPVGTYQPLAVRARVETADGVPLAGRKVTVWDDSYLRRCCGPPPSFTSDANGEIRTTLYLDGNSLNPVRVAVYWHGDTTYDKAITEWYQPVAGHTTTLTVSNDSQRTSGDTLPVTVSVRRRNADGTTTCITGALVRLVLSGPQTREATATVDWNGCKGTATFDLTLTPGVYTLTASTGHDGWSRSDEPVTVSNPVRVSWGYSFVDSYGRGVIYVNTATQEYRVVLADDRDSGIRAAGDDMVWTRVTGPTVVVTDIKLDHDYDGGSAHGTFVRPGAFTVSGTLGGAPYELAG